jgi:hypothetical protein
MASVLRPQIRPPNTDPNESWFWKAIDIQLTINSMSTNV